MEHSAPRFAKSAERIEGAIIAGGDIAADLRGFARRLAEMMKLNRDLFYNLEVLNRDSELN